MKEYGLSKKRWVFYVYKTVVFWRVDIGAPIVAPNNFNQIFECLHSYGEARIEIKKFCVANGIKYYWIKNGEFSM